MLLMARHGHTLLRLKHYYPESVILAMLPTYTTSYYTDTKLAQANEVLKEICDHYDIPWVDLRECGLTTSMLPDGIHRQKDRHEPPDCLRKNPP